MRTVTTKACRLNCGRRWLEIGGNVLATIKNNKQMACQIVGIAYGNDVTDKDAWTNRTIYVLDIAGAQSNVKAIWASLHSGSPMKCTGVRDNYKEPLPKIVHYHMTVDPKPDNDYHVISSLTSPSEERGLYDALREHGFNRAPKQGCFYGTWSPLHEDIALALCDEIQEEDSTLLQRAEDRNYRFATYSGNAGRRSQQANAAAKAITDFIPLGQPILVGHHSEKRHRRDIERVQNLTRKSIDESDKAKYWSSRAAGVLSHAERTFNPGVIARRIKKLQAQKRKEERERKPTRDDIAWQCSRFISSTWPDKEWGTTYSELNEEEKALAMAHVKDLAERRKIRADRWIEHLTFLIGYWEAIYSSVSGGTTIQEQHPLKAGMWVRHARYGGWARIKRVNRSRAVNLITTISIDVDTYTGRDGAFIRKWEYERIAEYKTDAEYHSSK
jgi:hypothetical protein